MHTGQEHAPAMTAEEASIEQAQVVADSQELAMQSGQISQSDEHAPPEAAAHESIIAGNSSQLVMQPAQ